MLRQKVRKIHPEKDKKDWHEHLCLLHRLGREMVTTFCPYKDEVKLGPEGGDDCCDNCPYDILIDYDKDTELIQLWGDANVLNPAWDFTNYTKKPR